MLVQAGDLVLMASPNFIGRGIRFFTRTIGEPRSRVNHAAVGIGLNMVVEANDRGVQYNPLLPRNSNIAIFRYRNLTTPEAIKIIDKAKSFVGWPYGHIAIAMHLLDWLLFNEYVFRRLAKKAITCSGLAARCFAMAGIKFSGEASVASPDDLWDHVTSHPSEWQCIYSEIGLKETS